MIVSRIIGGLGNQMFQYAAGRAVSLQRNAPFRLDVSGFADYGLHQGFELSSVFNVTPEIASQKDIQGILGYRAGKMLRKLLAHPGAASFRGQHFVVEPHFHYWPGIADAPQDCYLVGYWQSERYFQQASLDIRADFTFRHPLEKHNAEIARSINQVNAVSLHVRRGDYASNPKTTATHGLCSLEYYRASIQHIAERVQQPVFFVFSDDIAWVKNNLAIGFPCEHVDHNQGLESYNDMHLMSLCRHHIIANSSFSWWGAWLNPRPDKIVVAPRRWFNDGKDTRDLLPENWVSV